MSSPSRMPSAPAAASRCTNSACSTTASAMKRGTSGGSCVNFTRACSQPQALAAALKGPSTRAKTNRSLSLRHSRSRNNASSGSGWTGLPQPWEKETTTRSWRRRCKTAWRAAQGMASPSRPTTSRTKASSITSSPRSSRPGHWPANARCTARAPCQGAK